MRSRKKGSHGAEQVQVARVSVITAAHDAAAYLSTAIESVLAQTYSDWEMIVVDDGSTDSTASIASGYGERITLVQQAHAGVSAARNAALRHACGEYVALLDADDAWLPSKLERQVAELGAHSGCGLCYTDAASIDEGGAVLVRRLAPLHTGVSCRDLLTGRLPFETSSVMMRRDLLGADPYPVDLVMAEDTYVHTIVLWRCAEHACYVQEPLTLYRVHAASVVRRTSGRERGRQIAVGINRALETMCRDHPVPAVTVRSARAYAHFQMAWQCIDERAERRLALHELARAIACDPRWAAKVSRQFVKLGLSYALPEGHRFLTRADARAPHRSRYGARPR